MSEVIKEKTPSPDVVACATCQMPLHGPYCSYCGEKKLDKHDRKVAHLFEELVHSFTHADSKFLRSIKYLIIKPGFLTSEYLAGRRKRYSSPLSLFLIANLLYLLATPVDTFNSRFQTITRGQPYSQALTPQVEYKLQQKRWTLKQLEEQYNEKSSHEAKLLLILFVFLLSLPVALLFISRKHYYFDYVVFSTEYFNFIMYVVMLLIPWLLILFGAIGRLMKHGGTIDVNFNSPFAYAAALLLPWAYLTVAAHRVFKQSWGLTIVKTAALVFCTVLAMFTYRFIAFEVTMWLL